MPGGGLVINNTDTNPHTFSFEVLKMSEDDDDLPHSQNRRERPNSQPLTRWEEDFDVAAGDSLREREFITEPGAYFVEVTTETGVSAGSWIGLYAAGRDGQQLAESHISVTAQEAGALSLSPVTLD